MNYRERNEEIKNLYLSGKTLRQIGNEFEISAQRVQEILKKMAIPRRKEKGERLNNNLPKLTENKHIDLLIDIANEKIKYYQKKYREQQQKFLTLKKYYKKRMLKELLELK